MVITLPIKEGYSGGAHGRLNAGIAEARAADSDQAEVTP